MNAVAMTSAGREAYAIADANLDAAELEFFAEVLSGDQERQLIRLLDRLISARGSTRALA